MSILFALLAIACCSLVLSKVQLRKASHTPNEERLGYQLLQA